MAQIRVTAGLPRRGRGDAEDESGASDTAGGLDLLAAAAAAGADGGGTADGDVDGDLEAGDDTGAARAAGGKRVRTAAPANEAADGTVGRGYLLQGGA